MPNFDQISQFTAEIKLLSVYNNRGHYIGILFPLSILTYVSACHLASACQIS